MNFFFRILGVNKNTIYSNDIITNNKNKIKNVNWNLNVYESFYYDVNMTKGDDVNNVPTILKISALLSVIAGESCKI